MHQTFIEGHLHECEVTRSGTLNLHCCNLLNVWCGTRKVQNAWI